MDELTCTSDRDMSVGVDAVGIKVTSVDSLPSQPQT